jgi:dUTP pyrophosphatase
LNFGQSLRIHPRSGLAWKTGITLLNCEGVVDADYVDPTFVMLYNISDVQFKITDGDRIAQAEIITASPRMNFDVISEKPVIKTDRKGGFGSTGV